MVEVCVKLGGPQGERGVGSSEAEDVYKSQTWEEYQAMSKAEIATRRERAADKLYAAGAHYVVDTLADLPEVLCLIHIFEPTRLRRSEYAGFCLKKKKHRRVKGMKGRNNKG